MYRSGLGGHGYFSCASCTLFSDVGRQPEVDNLQGRVVGSGQQQEVLGLQVSMADLVRVAVVQG